MNMKSVLLNLTLVASAVAATACGDDGLDPDVTGLLNAEVHDTPVGAGAFMGTAAGDMQVSIRSTGGTWVDVGSPNGITVELQSTAPTSVHGSTSVAAGTYDRVRLTFSGVTFTITDVGTTFASTSLAVLAGTADLELEISVAEFTVSSSAGTASVSFDLNVDDWLTDAMLTAGVIADGDLTGQLTAVATSG